MITNINLNGKEFNISQDKNDEGKYAYKVFYHDELICYGTSNKPIDESRLKAILGGVRNVLRGDKYKSIIAVVVNVCAIVGAIVIVSSIVLLLVRLISSIILHI